MSLIGSPVSDDGRGLKRRIDYKRAVEQRLARQRCRARIETGPPWSGPRSSRGSPVSDDGRGLKLAVGLLDLPALEGSPVSDDGRGLKLLGWQPAEHGPGGSPVSDDGRGLKRHRGRVGAAQDQARPSAMTGAD